MIQYFRIHQMFAIIHKSVNPNTKFSIIISLTFQFIT